MTFLYEGLFTEKVTFFFCSWKPEGLHSFIGSYFLKSAAWARFINFWASESFLLCSAVLDAERCVEPRAEPIGSPLCPLTTPESEIKLIISSDCRCYGLSCCHPVLLFLTSEAVVGLFNLKGEPTRFLVIPPRGLAMMDIRFGLPVWCLCSFSASMDWRH